MARPPETTPRFSIPVPLVLLVVAGVAVWWFVFREPPPEEPGKPSDAIETLPIDPILDEFQATWNRSDLLAIRKFEILEEPDDGGDEDDEPETPYFERKIAQLGWSGAGLPEITARDAKRTENVRYTITWTLTGNTQKMTTWWEWDEDTWRIATWKLPKE